MIFLAWPLRDTQFDIKYQQVIAVSDVRAQLKVLQQIQIEETKRRTERERAQLLKEAKSRSKQTNSEAKAKAKQVHFSHMNYILTYFIQWP